MKPPFASPTDRRRDSIGRGWQRKFRPAGGSVALLNVLRLHTITGDGHWRRIAERALRAHAPTLGEQPAALHEMLLALDYFTDAPPEVVLIWASGQRAPAAFVDPLRRTFMPNRALLGAAEGAELDALARLAPIAGGKIALSGRATAYVCERGECRLPATEPAAMEAQLAAVKAAR